MKLFKNLFKPRKKHEKYSDVKKYHSQVQLVIKKAEIFRHLSDTKLKSKTNEFRSRIKNDEKLDSLLVDVFAVGVVASERVLGLTPHPVQIYGAVVLHNGDVAEMKTGEGKTLTSSMTAYLNALEGKGVHIITVNDYLAERDAYEMGKLFLWLGLSVGFNNRSLNQISKKLAYSLDITYSTHNELGFDYLRDNMVSELKEKVQRSLNFAIVDECDSILVDDAITPLIISSGQKENNNLYKVANEFIGLLTKDDYSIDVETKTIVLTTEGSKKAEKGFNLENFYDAKHTVLIHHIQQALRANFIIQRGIDYVVQEGLIDLVDQNTGRILKGRSYSEGLQQALQVKENIEVTNETKTVATTTYQNLFRLYNKLSGMTGTAKTEEEEFLDVYNMRVEAIETNRPVVRFDDNDVVFGTKKAMHESLIKEVKKLHSIGQPILIGTRSVEASEELSVILEKEKLKHIVLNAKNHEKEGKIIESAGLKNSITIATNMAGRGTDIKISKEVVSLGGLAVLGCERNESRRIDNQLIGRSGRQGEKGFSKFFISWEDELLVRFAGEKAKQQAQLLKDESVESKVLTNVIKSAQKRIEGQNYDSRKTLVEYDDVIRKQRETIYKQRDLIIASKNLKSVIKLMYKHTAKTFCEANVIFIDKEKHIDGTALSSILVKNSLIEEELLNASLISSFKYDDGLKHVEELMEKSLEIKIKEFGKKSFDFAQKQMLLEIIDANWQNHIDTMTKLRSGIHLRSYSQKSPIQAYVKEGFNIFEDMKSRISLQIVYGIRSLEIKK